MNKKILAGMLIVTIISILVFLVAKKYTLAKIECTTPNDVCPSWMMVELKRFENENMFLAIGNVNNYLTKEKNIRKYTYQLKFPSSIEIKVVLRRPVFSMKTNDKYVLIDKDGYAISIQSESSFPVITGFPNTPDVNERAPKKAMYAFEILRNLNYLYQINEINFTNNSIRANVLDKSVIFPADGDSKLAIGALELIINQLNTSDQTYKIDRVISTIDLRYKNPVLR